MYVMSLCIVLFWVCCCCLFCRVCGGLCFFGLVWLLPCFELLGFSWLLKLCVGKIVVSWLWFACALNYLVGDYDGCFRLYWFVVCFQVLLLWISLSVCYILDYLWVLILLFDCGSLWVLVVVLRLAVVVSLGMVLNFSVLIVRLDTIGLAVVSVCIVFWLLPVWLLFPFRVVLLLFCDCWLLGWVFVIFDVLWLVWFICLVICLLLFCLFDLPLGFGL